MKTLDQIMNDATAKPRSKLTEFDDGMWMAYSGVDSDYPMFADLTCQGSEPYPIDGGVLILDGFVVSVYFATEGPDDDPDSRDIVHSEIFVSEEGAEIIALLILSKSDGEQIDTVKALLERCN